MKEFLVLYQGKLTRHRMKEIPYDLRICVPRDFKPSWEPEPIKDIDKPTMQYVVLHRSFEASVAVGMPVFIG